jgi:hypothetical protein
MVLPCISYLLYAATPPYSSCRKRYAVPASTSDLMGKLREKGVERPEQVKRAYMESDGTITVIKRAQ